MSGVKSIIKPRKTFASARKMWENEQETQVDENVVRDSRSFSNEELKSKQTFDPRKHRDLDDFVQDDANRLVLKQKGSMYWTPKGIKKVDDVCKTAHQATIVASFYLMVDGLNKNIDLEEFMTGASMLMSSHGTVNCEYEEVHAAVSYLASEENLDTIATITTAKQMITAKTAVRTNASLLDAGIGAIPFSETDPEKTFPIQYDGLSQDFNDSIRVPITINQQSTRFQDVSESLHSLYGVPIREGSEKSLASAIKTNKLMMADHTKLLDRPGIFFPEPVPTSKYGDCSLAAACVDQYFENGIDVLFVKDFVFSKTGDVVEHHRYGYEKVVPLPKDNKDCSYALLSTITNYSNVLSELRDLETEVQEMSREEKEARPAKQRLFDMYEKEIEGIRNDPLGRTPQQLKYATLYSPKPLGEKDVMAAAQEGKLHSMVFMMRSQDYCSAMTRGLNCPLAVVIDAPTMLLLVFHHSLVDLIKSDHKTQAGLISVEGWFLGVPTMAWNRPTWFNILANFVVARFAAIVCPSDYYDIVKNRFLKATLLKKKSDSLNKVFELLEKVYPSMSEFAEFLVYSVPMYGARKMFKYTGFKDIIGSNRSVRPEKDAPYEEVDPDDGSQDDSEEDFDFPDNFRLMPKGGGGIVVGNEDAGLKTSPT